MKQNNFVAIALVCILALAACTGKDNGNSSSMNRADSALNDENTLLRDSLDMARDYMNSLSILVNEVSDGLSEIKNMEQIVSSTNLGGETSDRRAQLRNDILLIKSSIQDRQNRLAELEAKLIRAEANSKYNEDSKKTMLQTIANLKQQLADQKIMIDELTARLDAANVRIKDLNQKVDSLKVENTEAAAENRKAREENQRAREEMVRLENEMNECFYAIGSKNELKNHKIIETGFLRKTKVMQSSNIMHSYFTKADKRTLNEINLHSKKAKVLTNHDKQTYSVEDVGGVKVLKIYNQDKFWEYSNYLVVQVD